MALPESQDRVLRALREGSQQARDVAERLRIDTSAAYRHLESLRVRGYVDAEHVAAGRGRPKKHYRLTPAGWETFPRDYALLLKALMDRLIRTHGKEHMMTHLAAIAADLGAPLAREQDLRVRLRKVVRLYNELGFEARIERTSNRLFLVQRNCPFLKIARDDPEALCACLDEGILRAALPGSHVNLDKSLAMGDARCVHEIRLPPGKDGRTLQSLKASKSAERK